MGEQPLEEVMAGMEDAMGAVEEREVEVEILTILQWMDADTISKVTTDGRK